MGSRSKNKGRRAELALAELLQGMGYTEVKAGACSSYGTEPDVSGLRGIHVECKNQEHLRLDLAVEQAKADAQKFRDGRPAVFHKKNRREWYVTMPLTDWARMYGAAIGQPPHLENATTTARTGAGATQSKNERTTRDKKTSP